MVVKSIQLSYYKRERESIEQKMCAESNVKARARDVYVAAY